MFYIKVKLWVFHVVFVGMMRGGDMHTPDCEGYVRLDDNKRYMALKSGILCYYNSDNVSISTPHSSFPLIG